MSIFHQPPTIYISEVCLRVIDFDKSINFYTSIFGFEVISRTNSYVLLGYNNNVLLKLVKAKTQKDYASAGLYHIAFLVKERSSLANWFYYHIKNNPHIFVGASDHFVSEAIYLEDIDGNGIEVYYDRDYHNWRSINGYVYMTTEMLDLDSFLKEVTTPTPKLPVDTIIGHLHLSVIDIEKTKSFYNLLGFKEVWKMKNASFLSHNNYHHHLGINSWNMQKSKIHQEDDANIENFVIQYPSEESLNEVLNNLKLNNCKFLVMKELNHFIIFDPNNIKVILKY